MFSVRCSTFRNERKNPNLLMLQPTSCSAVCTIRSSSVGMPRGRFSFPPGSGMNTRLGAAKMASAQTRRSAPSRSRSAVIPASGSLSLWPAFSRFVALHPASGRRSFDSIRGQSTHWPGQVSHLSDVGDSMTHKRGHFPGVSLFVNPELVEGSNTVRQQRFARFNQACTTGQKCPDPVKQSERSADISVRQEGFAKFDQPRTAGQECPDSVWRLKESADIAWSFRCARNCPPALSRQKIRNACAFGSLSKNQCSRPFHHGVFQSTERDRNPWLKTSPLTAGQLPAVYHIPRA